MNSRKGLLIFCLAGLAAIGCSDRELRPLNPCTLSSVSSNPKVRNLDKVDLLFMIDNSDSMEPKQALIRAQLPNMVRGLLNGDPNNDGTSEFPKVASLRVGVITSDMGVAGFNGRTPAQTAATGNANWAPTTPPNPPNPRATVIPTPTCGYPSNLNALSKLVFTGTFTSGDTAVTNVQVHSFDLVSRNVFPTLTTAELTDVIVTSLLDTTLPENAGLPVPAATKVASWDPATKTLTLTAAATGSATQRFTSTRTKYFLASKAEYGDDGLLYRSTNSTTAAGVPVNNPLTSAPVDCDVDGDGFDDTLAYGAGAGDMPAFLTFDQTGTQTQAEYLNNVVCVTNVGNGGCGFEQQLESIMKAISPPTVTDFHTAPGDSARGVGHNDPSDPTTNGSWFRSDSLLAIVYLSDEDDCSAADERVFDPTLAPPDNEPDAWVMKTPETAAYAGNAYAQINTRCQRFPQFLHDPKRYSDGILAAVGGDASRVVFAAITGIPQDLTDDPTGATTATGPIQVFEGSSNLTEILADTRMQYHLRDTSPRDGTMGAPDSYLDTACQNATTDSYATPGRRVVQVAQLLQTSAVPVFVSSICNDNFNDAVTQVLTLISNALAASCLPRPLNPNSLGLVGCQVREDLKAGEHCADLTAQGRSATGTTTADGREICLIEQLAVTGTTVEPGKRGWFYDDFSPSAMKCGSQRPQRVSFTAGDEPLDGRQIHIECLQTITGSGLKADINTPCSGAAATECDLGLLADRQAFCLRYNLHSPGCNDASAPNVLSCETMSNTCQIPCSTDADCPGSFDCYAANGGAKVCVNPTCGTQQ